MFIITRPGFGSFQASHVFALVFVTAHSLYVIMTRRMGATENSESLIFYSALTPALFMLLAAPLYGSMPQGGLQ